MCCGERRASRGALELPKRLLSPQLNYPGRQARAESSPGPQWTVFHRDFRALPAQREGAGGGLNRDVHPRSIDPEGQAISEELCGRSFSASAISGFNKKLDEELGRFARRKLDCEYPYLILDARYEKVRENGVIRSRAVLVAIGIDWEGRRQILGVEMANRESSTSWKDFLLALKARGLRGVILAVSDNHPGLKRAIMGVLPEAYWQRCYVHFLRNALDYLPRKVADDCLVELRWLYDRRNAEEARRDLTAWLLCWQEKYPKLCAWVEDNIEQTLTFYPRASQTPKEYQHARTAQRGTRTSNPCHPNLPQ